MNSAPEPTKEIQIGGQAVIEGVVMRGPEKWAVAVRRPAGDIQVEVNPTSTLAQKYPRANVFALRGIMALVDSLVIGMKSLSISANISLQEEDEEGVDGDGESAPAMSTAAVAVALTISLVLFLGIFIALPVVLARPLQDSISNTVLFNLVEGSIRIAIFIGYLAAISLIPDVRRLYSYHGAEHKVVHAYEHGLPLTAETADEFSTAHMRCGTTFIVIVFIISILVFSLMGRPPLWLRILERIAVIPLVAAISYEIIRFAGRHEENRFVRVIMTPGLWFQKLTTRRPDEDQLEVAVRALEAAVGD